MARAIYHHGDPHSQAHGQNDSVIIGFAALYQQSLAVNQHSLHAALTNTLLSGAAIVPSNLETRM